jgi:hypothetical protein
METCPKTIPENFGMVVSMMKKELTRDGFLFESLNEQNEERRVRNKRNGATLARAIHEDLFLKSYYDSYGQHKRYQVDVYLQFRS